MTIPGGSLETLKVIKFIIPTIKSHIPFPPFLCYLAFHILRGPTSSPGVSLLRSPTAFIN